MVKTNALGQFTDIRGEDRLLVDRPSKGTTTIPFNDTVGYYAQALLKEGTAVSEALNNKASLGPDGKLEMKNIPSELIIANNAGAHNGIYRGKALGGAVTAGQYAAIGAGTFKDLYIGDYWTIGGVNWRIAAFDYYLNTGDTKCTTHHAVIVPDTCLYRGNMNDTDSTYGSYAGCRMKTLGLAAALATIEQGFGADHILTHRKVLTNAVSNGASAGWAWYSSRIDLMNEHMVYGAYAWGGGSQNGFDTGTEKSQFPLFALEPGRIGIRTWYWIRDVVSDNRFAAVSEGGGADNNHPSLALGVRPTFCICA